MSRVLSIGRVAVTISTFAVAIMATGGTMAPAAVVTGQNGVVLSVYSNPFDPNNDGVGSGTEATGMGFGGTGGTVVVQSGWSQADLVNRHDTYGEAPGNALRLYDSAGTATSAFATYTAASSFKAGTIISYQWVFGPFANPTPYTMKLDGTTVQTGPGIQGSNPIQVTTLSSVTSASQLRLDFGMSTYGPSGPTYAEMNEVMILPRRMERIVPTAVTQTAGIAWFGAPSTVSDLDGYGWGGQHDSVNNLDPSLKLDFGAPKLVSTLVLANFFNAAVSFNIKDDTGTVIGHIEMTGNNVSPTYGDFIPVNFDTPVLTSFLTFDFTSVDFALVGGDTAMRKIMVFSDLPEPTSLSLVGLARLDCSVGVAPASK